MPTPKAPRAKKIAPKAAVKATTSQRTLDREEEQKRLRRLIERRHPKFKDMLKQWQFLQATYEGGREWFDENIHQYVKEGENEFAERLERCYRFNHTREVVELLNKYLFKQNIVRSQDAPASVQKFWDKATKSGMSIRDLARQAGKRSSVVGRIAIVIDNNAAGVVSKADEKKVQTYAYIVGPTQLLDYGFDEHGELLWVLIEECHRDDTDPFESSGEESPRYRLWTRDFWALYEERKIGNTNKTRIVEIDSGELTLGEVPVILHDHMLGEEDKYATPSLVDDIAYLDRAVANYLSNLDAIIQDQTFSQLVMPAQNLLPGEDHYAKMLEMGTSRIFLYDGQGGAQPSYISPDPKQAQMILAVINKIINEIYHTVGLAGERTKQDNALGIDNSSGVAKAYDFERVNALLAAKADSLEVLENKITRLVARWNGEKVERDYVSYPDNFDTRGLYDEFDIAARLMLVEAPDAIRQVQMESLVDKLFPQLKDELRAKILAQLKEWPIDPVEQAGELAAATEGAKADAQKTLQGVANKGVAKATMDAK